MQKVWVELGADGSRAHGPTLQMHLVLESHPLVQTRLSQSALSGTTSRQVGRLLPLSTVYYCLLSTASAHPWGCVSSHVSVDGVHV